MSAEHRTIQGRSARQFFNNLYVCLSIESARDTSHHGVNGPVRKKLFKWIRRVRRVHESLKIDAKTNDSFHSYLRLFSGMLSRVRGGILLKKSNNYRW